MAAERDRPRSYDSPLRRRQAEATRAAVRDAAASLFLRDGYVRTSIRAVADEAGVSPETVYAGFGSKRDLLKAVVEHAAHGSDEPWAVIDPAWVERLRAEPSPVGRLALMAERTRGMLDRTAALDEVIRVAARSDPAVRELEDDLDARRRTDVGILVDLIAEVGALRLPRSDAVDVIWAISTSDLYLRLRRGRRWSARRADDVVQDLLARVLLP